MSLDSKIQKIYTAIGQKLEQKIPERGLSICKYVLASGSWGISSLLAYYFNVPPKLSLGIGFIIGEPECLGNISDFVFPSTKRKNEIINWEGLVADHEVEFYKKYYNRPLRLPLFLAGVGFLGKSAWDISRYLTIAEPLTQETSYNIQIGAGLLSFASSLYLNDQDPRLLKKADSKVKVFLKNIYEKAKDLIIYPNPEPQPIPIPTKIT